MTGSLGTLLAFDGGAPAAVSFVIDISTKHITQFGKVLALTNATSLTITKTNKIYISSGIQEEGLDPDPLNKQYYFDKINGQPIIHESNVVNNYEIKTYYNHFIYLALETAANGTATIRINFTTTSNELINTLDKLKSALGETFTLGGNGSIVNGSTYGTTYMVNQNGITGVVNGAQQVFNFTDGTLTITDSVKQA